MDILIFIVSISVLVLGSEWFISSAERIGLSFGISHFIIGVTIVAFGTSLPELATSIVSVLTEKPEVVMGNVIGSNITNILLVLGLSALHGALVGKLRRAIWEDVRDSRGSNRLLLPVGFLILVLIVLLVSTKPF